MCIAIYKPADKNISKRILGRCWNNNNDGAGFMYAKDDRLYVDKGYFEFKKFWKAIRPHILDDPKALVIHFRIATSGKVDAENCHPFLINDGLGLVHNGIISDLNDGIDRCDTLRMAMILKHLPEDFIHNDSIMKLVELAVGNSNKFVFMNSKGEVKFINESTGIVVDGVWYSNGSFRYDRFYSSTYGRGDQYTWERGIYSTGASYSKESGYRYAPRNEYINRVIVSQSEATAEGTLVPEKDDHGDGGVVERDVRVPRHKMTDDWDRDYPPSAMFREGQRFDVYIEEEYDEDTGEVTRWTDAYGISEDEYEGLAYSEAAYWMRHHESISPYAFQDLADILEMADDGEPIREMLQDWLDMYEPSMTKSIVRQIEAEEKAAKYLKDGVVSAETRRVGDMTPGEKAAAVIELGKEVADSLRGRDDRQLLLDGIHD